MKSMICENTVRPRFMFASASRWEASRIGRNRLQIGKKLKSKKLEVVDFCCEIKDLQGCSKVSLDTTDIVYVLHCFEKRTAQTERKDLEVAKERLKRLRER